MGNSDKITSEKLVLVTGGSGYIATYCIVQLLKAGYKVNTTLRTMSRKEEVISLIKSAGTEPEGHLNFYQADLLSDDGWVEAVKSCEYVLHVASPFPASIPKNENELIIPAREGALRVLKASRDAGVKRVVMTSSMAAVGYGLTDYSKVLDETSWTNLNGQGLTAYVKSKTIAEKAAWDFIKSEGGDLELSVVNPVGVFGPVMGNDYSSSIEIIKRLMDGSMPGCPKLSFGVVDVRDVASLHLLAMTHPAAKGERFLAVAGDNMTMLEMAQLIKAKMGKVAKKVPTRNLPNFLLRFISLFDSSVKQVVPELGKVKKVSNKKAKTMLGWKPRNSEDAVLATAESLVKLKLV